MMTGADQCLGCRPRGKRKREGWRLLVFPRLLLIHVEMVPSANMHQAVLLSPVRLKRNLQTELSKERMTWK